MIPGETPQPADFPSMYAERVSRQDREYIQFGTGSTRLEASIDPERSMPLELSIDGTRCPVLATISVGENAPDIQHPHYSGADAVKKAFKSADVTLALVRSETGDMGFVSLTSEELENGRATIDTNSEEAGTRIRVPLGANETTIKPDERDIYTWINVRPSRDGRKIEVTQGHMGKYTMVASA